LRVSIQALSNPLSIYNFALYSSFCDKNYLTLSIFISILLFFIFIMTMIIIIIILMMIIIIIIIIIILHASSKHAKCCKI